MIKRYLFSAYWRKKDVEFLKGLELNRQIEEGFYGFNVNQKTHDIILSHYSKESSLFNKTKPKDFKVSFTGVTFSKEELDSAKYYMLFGTGTPKGYARPKEDYQSVVFSSECGNYRVNRRQITQFRMKKPVWAKKEFNFSLEGEWDFMFFNKEFYQEVLAPLGLKYKEVINHSTGKPLEDTVQLDIQIAKSKLLIDNSAYDIHPVEETCGSKQYAVQYLDFFPLFEKEFDFHICYTQEEFYGGYRRIIISKEFCKLLVKHKVIKYHTGHLIPMKNI